MNPLTLELVLKLVDLLVIAIKVAPNVYAQYQETRHKISLMIQEGRDPTPAEWEQLNAEIDKLHHAFHPGN